MRITFFASETFFYHPNYAQIGLSNSPINAADDIF